LSKDHTEVVALKRTIPPHKDVPATRVQEEPVPLIPLSTQGLPSEQLPTGWLVRRVRTRDLAVLCLIAVMLISNVPLVASGGGATFLYWMIGFVTFLLPSALVCLQLYRLFPGEGAVYLWANKAFGNFWDAFLGFYCHWLPGMLGLLVSVSTLVTFVQALNANWLHAPWQQGVAEMIALGLAQALCLLPQKIFSRLINGVFLAYGSMFVLLALAALVWLGTGHAAQGDFTAQGWQVSVSHWPIVAVTILCLVGIEVPLNLGGEVIHPKAVERALLWSTGVIMLGYLLATFAIAVVLSPQDASNPAMISTIFRRALGPLIGTALSGIFNGVMVLYFIGVTAAFNCMFARLLLVVSVDRRLPRVLRRLDQHQVPYHATLCQTGINVILVGLIYVVAPAFAPSNPAFALVVFLITINGGSVIWNMAMIGLFLCGLILFARERRQLAGRWMLPAPLLSLSALLGIGASCIAIAGTLFGGSPVPQVLDTADWEYWMFVVVLASLAIGATYSFLVPEREDLVALLRRKHRQVTLDEKASTCSRE
jgi:amino acid transporter